MRFLLKKTVIVLWTSLVFAGCQVAGSRNRTSSERSIAHYVGGDVAHAVCWHLPVDSDILVSLYGKWLIDNDDRFFILTHPQFPLELRQSIIARNGVDDYYFSSAINYRCFKDEDVLAYLDHIKGYSFSRCAPLRDLMCAKGMPCYLYEIAWREYKEKRERMPFWGYVLPDFIIKSMGIRICERELRTILLNKSSLPVGVVDDIELQLRSL